VLDWPTMDAALMEQRPALRLARVAWWLLAVAMAGHTIASLPGYIQSIRDYSFLEVPLAVPGSWGLALNILGAAISLAAAVLSIALAGLLFWRRSDEPMALFVSVFLLLYAVMIAGPLERLVWLWPGAMAWAFGTAQPLFFTLPVVALLSLFPNGRLVPRWTLILIVASFILAGLVFWLPSGWVQGIQSPLVITFEVGLLICALGGLYAQLYRYRQVSTPAEQRQVRWAMYGLCLWGFLLLLVGGPWLFLMSLPPAAPVPWWTPLVGILWNVALVVLPLSLTIAVLRYRLYAIDRVIRRTLVYSLLTGLLALIYFSTVAVLQVVLRAASGQSSELAIVLSTLAIAALFAPLRLRIQAFIDRRLFRTHYDVARTLAGFGSALREDANGDLGLLARRLETVIDETMQPESVWLWLAPLSESRRDG
jgi:hypothetical protein